MKASLLIAGIAAGALSASAAACPLPGLGKLADGASQQPVRTLLATTETSSCTPRMYWFPAECSSDRAAASAKAAHITATHAIPSDAETCIPRIYWFPAHCQ
jgi:hypothetical protein